MRRWFTAQLHLVLLGTLLLAVPAPAAADPFQVGLALNRDADAAQARSLGARVGRMDVRAGTTAESLDPLVEAYEAQGIKLVLMFSYGYGRVPSPEEARSVGAWAKRFGPRLAGIELGNETLYRHARGPGAGAAYGRAVAAALDAIQAADARVPLLVQADDGNTALDAPVRDLIAAAPELRDPGANVGWTIHPYGLDIFKRLERLVSQVDGAGAHVSRRQPVWVTEWGLATDGGRRLTPHNYGHNPAMGFEEAARVLRDTIGRSRSILGDRLRAFLVYQREDRGVSGTTSDREMYFGMLRKGGGEKGALTAEFRRLAAAHPGE